MAQGVLKGVLALHTAHVIQFVFTLLETMSCSTSGGAARVGTFPGIVGAGGFESSRSPGHARKVTAHGVLVCVLAVCRGYDAPGRSEASPTSSRAPRFEPAKQASIAIRFNVDYNRGREYSEANLRFYPNTPLAQRLANRHR